MRTLPTLLSIISAFSLIASGDGFVVNKGQIHDQFRKPNPDVLYLYNSPGMNVQLRKDGFAYDTYTVNELEHETDREWSRSEGMRTERVKSTYNFHRIDLRFATASGAPRDHC
jgi:hypothetical protein